MGSQQVGFSPFTRFMVIAASAGLILYVLRYAGDFLAEILFAFFLVVGIYPLLRWMTNKGVPTWLGVVLIILAVSAIGILLSGYLYASIASLQDEIPAYQAGVERIRGEISAVLGRYDLRLSEMLSTLSLNFNQLFGYVGDVLEIISVLVGSMIVILFLFIMFMSDSPGFVHRFNTLPGMSENTSERFGGFGRNVITYFRVRAVNGLIVATMLTILLLILRVDLAFLWGVLAFFLGFIPTIGLPLAVAPAVLLSLLKQGWVTASIVIIGAVVINQIGDSIITPRMTGKSLNLSTSIVFLSFLFWAWVLGPIGALISVPLTLVVILILESFDETRWMVQLFVTSDDNKSEEDKGKGDDMGDSGDTEIRAA